jgi:diguanylate cyclase
MNPATPQVHAPQAKPRGAELVRTIYALRVAGCALSGVCILSAPPAAAPDALYWLGLVYFGLIWPHLAYAWASRSSRPLRAEFINLWLDSVHAGFWVAAVQMSFVPTVALLAATSLGSITSGGIRLLLLGFVGHGVGLLVGAGVWGWHFQPESSLLTQLGAMPLLMTYPLLVGRLMHRQTSLLKQNRRELRYLSEHDALSGVYNRRHFDVQLRQAFSQFLRHPRPMTLVICDADDFKQINDRLGHAAGDEVIRQMGAALGGSARTGDIVARLGGDEFVALLSDTTSEEALRFAQRVQARLDDALLDSPLKQTVHLSFGAAMADTRMRDHEHWLEHADTALYRSKSGNRGGFTDAGAPLAPHAITQPAG